LITGIPALEGYITDSLRWSGTAHVTIFVTALAFQPTDFIEKFERCLSVNSLTSCAWIWTITNQ
jgi:hypothetical protein